MLDNADVQVAHETLVIGLDVLRLPPIAGLSEVARTLLHIWDSLQKVDVREFSQFFCLTQNLIIASLDR